MSIERFLSIAQQRFLESYLPHSELVADMSWGLTDMRVLHIRQGNEDYVVKAAAGKNTHIGREILAHKTITFPLVKIGRSPELKFADESLNILVTRYLPGQLVENASDKQRQDIYHQAGSLLKMIHAQGSYVDENYERLATQKELTRLQGKHRINWKKQQQVEDILRGYEPRPIEVVPTHGDWHARNWLLYRDQVSVIDFGRFAYRPKITDFVRMAFGSWWDNPELEKAFFAGYGKDPRELLLWNIELLRQAVGTAVWAYQVKDFAFEEFGLEKLTAILSHF